MKKYMGFIFIICCGLSFALSPLSACAAEDNGIRPVPDRFSQAVKNSFTNYAEVIAPNGKPIEILAQDQITEEQIIHARSILSFYLTDVPGSVYGADKSAVTNKMAENGARLLLLNGSDEGVEPVVDGQPLYATELIVTGTDAYINNDYENHRDATFEEILHLVHDYGIGIDLPGVPEGALPAFQAKIREAQTRAMPETGKLWGLGAENANWLAELKAEGSLTQEYLASVVDSYYGLWGAHTESAGGMWGVYIAKTREEVKSKDPAGYALMEMFFSPDLTYDARIHSGFTGTFSMAFDENTPYTHKSRYLLNAFLTGSADSNLSGNENDNRLGGNSGNNVLNGKGGMDTAVFTGSRSEYSIAYGDNGTVVVTDSAAGRDGVDSLIAVEMIAFSDRKVTVSAAAGVPTLKSDNGNYTLEIPCIEFTSGKESVLYSAELVSPDNGASWRLVMESVGEPATLLPKSAVLKERAPGNYLLEIPFLTAELPPETLYYSAHFTLEDSGAAILVPESVKRIDSPQYPLTNRRILFAHTIEDNSHLFSVNLATGEKKQLTFEGDNIYASYSPAADLILFTSNRGGNYELYSMGTDGSGQTRLTHTPMDDERYSAWHPNGVDYVVEVMHFTEELRNQERETGSLAGAHTKLYRCSIRKDASIRTQLTNPPDNHGDGYPSFSPDGKYLVFDRTFKYDAPDEASSVYMLNMETSTVTEMSDGDSTPRFMPAQNLFFTGEEALNLYETDGTFSRSMEMGAGCGGSADFSRDEKFVVYQGKDTGKQQIFVYDLENKREYPITSDDGEKFEPIFLD